MSCHIRLGDFEFSPTEIREAVERGRLLTMEIEFSLKCNFLCRYCYVQGRPSFNHELKPDEIKDVLLQARELGARRIIVLGGEPMIYPHILDMLTFIRHQGMDAEMFTNGTNMTEERARRLGELGVQVVLKMNSFKKEVQDDLAGRRGAYEIIQTALANLRKAGYPAPDRPMAGSTVICRQNLDEIVPLWRWFRDQGIAPYFEVITPQSAAANIRELAVESETTRAIFEQLSEVDRSYGYSWDPQPPLVGNRCLRHQFSCLVNASGYVMPCVGVPLPAGNIRERKLADIIRDSEVIQDLRRFPETIKGPCIDCEKSNECYGCRGAAFQLTGDYLASDPLCWRNAARRGEIASLPVAVDAYIPQKDPMRVADRLLFMGDGHAIVDWIVPENGPFVDAGGTLDREAYMEIMAQAMAALHGFRRTRNGSRKPGGLLLGAKNLEILGTARAGDRLVTTIHKRANLGDFGIIEAIVCRGDEVLARGEIKVLEKLPAGMAMPGTPGSGVAAAARAGLAVLALLSLLAAGSPAATAPGDLSKVAEELKPLAESVRTIQAGFQQENRLAVFDQAVTLSGEMAIEKPGRLAWRVATPVRYALVMDGNRVTEWDEGTGKVRQSSLSANPVMQVVAEQLTPWLSGEYDKLESTYEVACPTTEPVVLEFTPRDGNPVGKALRNVTVRFRADRTYVDQIRIESLSGDVTTISFLDPVVNQPIEAAVWEVAADGR